MDVSVSAISISGICDVAYHNTSRKITVTLWPYAYRLAQDVSAVQFSIL